ELQIARIKFVNATVSPNPRRLPCQDNSFIIVENRSFDLERDLSAMRVKNICRSGILSVLDFTAEEKRARLCTYLQHPCTRFLIMELPRLAIRDQIHH